MDFSVSGIISVGNLKHFDFRLGMVKLCCRPYSFPTIAASLLPFLLSSFAPSIKDICGLIR